MLKANKKLWFVKLFAIYNRNLLKRRFNSLHIKNFEPLKNRNKNIPLIIYANHSSWWDGLVFSEILKNKDFDSYVMMEEKQLKNLRFFNWLGAFSVIRENHREAIKSLNYAIQILKCGTNKTLLIFPQGEILANDFRPFKFFNGVTYILEKLEKCNIVPCSIRYEFLQNFKPEIYLKFGALELIEPAKKFHRKKFTENLQEKMLLNLEELKSDIIENKLTDYRNIL